MVNSFTCPFTGATEGLVPSRRRLLNGEVIVLWVHPNCKNAIYARRVPKGNPDAPRPPKRKRPVKTTGRYDF